MKLILKSYLPVVYGTPLSHPWHNHDTYVLLVFYLSLLVRQRQESFFYLEDGEYLVKVEVELYIQKDVLWFKTDCTTSVWKRCSVATMTWLTVCVSNDHGCVPFIVITTRFFSHSWLIAGFVTRVARRVSHLEQKLLTLILPRFLVGFVLPNL